MYSKTRKLSWENYQYINQEKYIMLVQLKCNWFSLSFFQSRHYHKGLKLLQPNQKYLLLLIMHFVNFMLGLAKWDNNHIQEFWDLHRSPLQTSVTKRLTKGMSYGNIINPLDIKCMYTSRGVCIVIWQCTFYHLLPYPISANSCTVSIS